MQVFPSFVPQLRDPGNHHHLHPGGRSCDFLNRLSDDGAGSSGLVLPGGGQDTDGLVVAGKTVNSGLDENEAELGVLVLAVALKVLADSNSLNQLDQGHGGKKIGQQHFTFLMSMYRSSGSSGARPV